LERAVLQRRRVRVRYHGSDRIGCPHVLGWKKGCAKALLYQVGGMTSQGSLPDDRGQRWRSVFVDGIEEAMIVDGPWETADNFSGDPTGVDTVYVAVAAERDGAEESKPSQPISLVGAG
jgi:hypothetical protein